MRHLTEPLSQRNIQKGNLSPFSLIILITVRKCSPRLTHRELNVLAGLPVLEIGRGGDDVVVELDRRRAQEYHMREELCRVVENLQSLEKNTQLSFFTMG